jgi:hypothetical protein
MRSPSHGPGIQSRIVHRLLLSAAKLRHLDDSGGALHIELTELADVVEQLAAHVQWCQPAQLPSVQQLVDEGCRRCAGAMHAIASSGDLGAEDSSVELACIADELLVACAELAELGRMTPGGGLHEFAPSLRSSFASHQHDLASLGRDVRQYLHRHGR